MEAGIVERRFSFFQLLLYTLCQEEGIDVVLVSFSCYTGPLLWLPLAGGFSFFQLLRLRLAFVYVDKTVVLVSFSCYKVLLNFHVERRLLF